MSSRACSKNAFGASLSGCSASVAPASKTGRPLLPASPAWAWRISPFPVTRAGAPAALVGGTGVGGVVEGVGIAGGAEGVGLGLAQADGPGLGGHPVVLVMVGTGGRGRGGRGGPHRRSG